MAAVRPISYLEPILGEAEWLQWPPRTAVPPASELPEAKAAIAADQRWLASPERAALLAGDHVAWGFDTDAFVAPEPARLPAIIWTWDHRVNRHGILVLCDPIRRLPTPRYRHVQIARFDAQEPLREMALPEETSARRKEARSRRDAAFERILAAGKVPTVGGYTWEKFAIEMVREVGLRDDEVSAPGFDGEAMRKRYGPRLRNRK
jgi:hypothetical protein